MVQAHPERSTASTSWNPRRVSSPSWLRVLVASAVLAAFPGCADQETAASAPGAPALAPGSIQLLRRTPDELLEQPGTLIPSQDSQWGALGLSGWSQYTTHDGSGRPGVWAKRRDAVLALPVAHLRDRTIELIAWVAAPPDGQPREQRIELLLNDLRLGTVVLTPEPSEVRVPAPRDAWRIGTNELTLRVPETRAGWNGEPLGVGLSHLSYGMPRRVVADVTSGRLKLEPHTQLRYRVEGARGHRLELHGTTSAHDGALEVTLRTFDSLTVQTLAIGEAQQFLAKSGAVGASLELPASSGRILEIELRWIAEDDGKPALELDRLAITGGEPVVSPPIVLISLDTVGAQHLSVYGYARRTSPRLEEFARESVVFDRCLANSTWTVPSHMSLFTGLLPGVHARTPQIGASDVADLWEMWQLDERRWTLAEALRAAGYHTAAFVDTLWLSGLLNFSQGFDVFDDSAAHIGLDDTHGGIERVAALAFDWLDARDDRPPFAFLHCFDAHGPYTVPEPWRDELAGRTLTQPVSSAYAGALDHCFGGIHSYIAAPYATADGLPKRLPTDPIADAYDEGLLALDARLGAFFDELRKTPLWDEAVIIVTADHGESMTGHEFYFAHGVAYDEILHVPLIVKLPRGARGGTRITEAVSLVDVYSTVLELARLDPNGRGRHGRSLAPALRGEPLAAAPLLAQGGLMRQAALEFDRWKLLAFDPTQDADLAVALTFPGVPAEWRKANVPELEDSALTAELYAAIQQDPARADRLWRELVELIGGPHHVLFDLRTDPAELRDVAGEQPERVAALFERLAAELARIEESRSRLSTSAPPRGPSEADRAALEALGYSGRK